MVSFASPGTPITAFEAAEKRREGKFGQRDDQKVNGNFEAGD